MRITDVRTIPVVVKLPKPVFDANYTMATKPALLVEVETDQGLVGLGEAAHFGGPMASTAQVIEHELRQFDFDGNRADIGDAHGKNPSGEMLFLFVVVR